MTRKTGPAWCTFLTCRKAVACIKWRSPWLIGAMCSTGFISIWERQQYIASWMLATNAWWRSAGHTLPAFYLLTNRENIFHPWTSLVFLSQTILFYVVVCISARYIKYLSQSEGSQIGVTSTKYTVFTLQVFLLEYCFWYCTLLNTLLQATVVQGCLFTFEMN